MPNPYKALKRLLGQQPVQVGEITAIHSDGVSIQLPTGETLRARGEGTIGQTVFLRDGAVEGPAPDLSDPATSTIIEI
jgi:hypothetical protein